MEEIKKSIDVRQAVKTAIIYVKEVFEEEHLSNVGLEEVVYNDSDHLWEVTVGFSRPWNYPKTSALTPFDVKPQPVRDYKIVFMKEGGDVIKIENRNS